jgi:predicted Fe-S protein YdhL (DUF1289 family)
MKWLAYLGIYTRMLYDENKKWRNIWLHRWRYTVRFENRFACNFEVKRTAKERRNMVSLTNEKELSVTTMRGWPWWETINGKRTTKGFYRESMDWDEKVKVTKTKDLVCIHCARKLKWIGKWEKLKIKVKIKLCKNILASEVVDSIIKFKIFSVQICRCYNNK